MEDAVKTELTKDEMIAQLMELLRQNNRKREANDAFELCAYIDSLENKLDAMTEEISNMQKQLNDMREDKVLHHLKAQMKQSAEKLETKCAVMREKLFDVKNHIQSKAAEIVSEAKRKGRAALNKVSEFFGIKSKLAVIRSHVRESGQEVAHTIAKIDTFGAGMREAGEKIVNTFRTFADKEEVDYSQKERKFSKTELIKKPWLAKQKLLKEMELRLDGAINKVENLSRNVERDQMGKEKDIQDDFKYDSRGMSGAATMVAELETEYGADLFEAHMKKQEKEKLPEVADEKVMPKKEKQR